MDIESITGDLERRESGIFFSKSNSPISYPDNAHKNCLQIEQDSFWFQHRNDVISESVKMYSPNKHFLDIGGGNGFVSQRLQKDGIKTALLEPGLAGAKNAKNRGIQKVICSSFENAKFEASSIESAGLFDVLEHIENDGDFLKKVHYTLQTDGYIYITVPAYTFLWSDKDNIAGHYRRYTLRKLHELLERCDFKVVYSTYIFSFLPLPIFFFRTLPSRLKKFKISTRLKKSEQEHSVDQSRINLLMQKNFSWELNRIKNAKEIHVGSSCLVVANKV